MSGAGSRLRRNMAYSAARTAVYGRRGAQYDPAVNPFDHDPRQHRIFARAYELARDEYWRLEAMREEMETVYGGPPRE